MSKYDEEIDKTTKLCSEARKQIRKFRNDLEDAKYEGRDNRPCKKCQSSFYKQVSGLKQEVESLGLKLEEEWKVDHTECTCQKEETGREAVEHFMEENTNFVGSEVKTRKEKKRQQNLQTFDSGYGSTTSAVLKEVDVKRQERMCISDRESGCCASGTMDSSLCENDKSKEIDANRSYQMTDSNESVICDFSRNVEDSVKTMKEKNSIDIKDEGKKDISFVDTTEVSVDNSESTLEEIGSIHIGGTQLGSAQPTLSIERTKDSFV